MPNSKKALITGITGQDGSYLAEFLLEKGYEVFGVIRRSSSFNRQRIEHLYFSKGSKYGEQLKLFYGDLNDASSLNRIIDKVQPDEIYNLAAQSHVGISFEIPEYTAEITAVGTIRLLDAIKDLGIKTRFYQASSSEMFGNSKKSPQNELTPLNPCSPYACAKVYAYHVTKNYREAYRMFACNGILFNHESPRRGENFVSRKITLSLARIKLGLQPQLLLGNLDARRDWGYAKDYVEVMWLMLKQKKADDYVIATGKTYSVREFVEKAAALHGYQIAWHGKGKQEKGIDAKTGKVIVAVDPKYFRPTEVTALCGDPAQAIKKLSWNPRKTSFEKLIEIMVLSDIQVAEKELLLSEAV
ncbi:MAG: GDP-mannose 4,6-dehydratase [Candidatus Margulisiibacteriota bacterium]